MLGSRGTFRQLFDNFRTASGQVFGSCWATSELAGLAGGSLIGSCNHEVSYSPAITGLSRDAVRLTIGVLRALWCCASTSRELMPRRSTPSQEQDAQMQAYDALTGQRAKFEQIWLQSTTIGKRPSICGASASQCRTDAARMKYLCTGHPDLQRCKGGFEVHVMTVPSTSSANWLGCKVHVHSRKSKTCGVVHVRRGLTALS